MAVEFLPIDGGPGRPSLKSFRRRLREKNRLKPELQRLLLRERSGRRVDGLPRRNNTSWTRERKRRVSSDATVYEYASCVDRSRQADAYFVPLRSGTNRGQAGSSVFSPTAQAD